jgi:hypothetical protein
MDTLIDQRLITTSTTGFFILLNRLVSSIAARPPRKHVQTHGGTCRLPADGTSRVLDTCVALAAVRVRGAGLSGAGEAEVAVRGAIHVRLARRVRVRRVAGAVGCCTRLDVIRYYACRTLFSLPGVGLVRTDSFGGNISKVNQTADGGTPARWAARLTFGKRPVWVGTGGAVEVGVAGQAPPLL